MSPLVPAVIAEGDPNDPRNAAGKDRTLTLAFAQAGEEMLLMGQQTKRSGFSICCAVEHRGAVGVSQAEGSGAVWSTGRRMNPGTELSMEKSICYLAARGDAEKLPEQAAALCHGAPDFDTLLREQRETLDAFWEGVGLSIEGDDALLQGLRFKQFFRWLTDSLRSVSRSVPEQEDQVRFGDVRSWADLASLDNL